MPTDSSLSRPRRLRFFALWLCCFYTGWLLLVWLGNHWQAIASHWPIALAMALGSYVAGSTPMGGGTVGFPVLVLLFDQPGALGRNFALAVQSVGMVSATLYILATRSPLAWGLLRPAMLGSLIGTPLGALLVAPLVPDLWVKLTFAVIWAGFGIMHLLRMNELIGAQGRGRRSAQTDRMAGLLVGLLGGVIASLTGVGIDMVLYATMVLLFRSDLRVSIPSSVVLMAFTSVVGITTNMALAQWAPHRFAIDPEVFANWIAAAPVVVLGAPLGALVVQLIPRKPTLYIVSLLCIAQFVWTLVHERVAGGSLLAALAGLLLVSACFHVLHKLGQPRTVAG